MELLYGIILSLFLGALLGLEREYYKGKIGIGIRTTTFISLLGTISTYLSVTYNNPLILILSIITAASYSISIFWYRVKKEKFVGLTTSSVMLLSFFIGSMIGVNLVREAIATAILISFMLASKKRLVKEIKSLSEIEILNATEFAILAFVIYPFLPDIQIFSVRIINVWETILLISVISFIGFIAMKKTNMKKGIIAIGAIGGLISSNASTISLINYFKKNKRLVNVFTISIMMAMLISITRNFLIGFMLSWNINLLVPFIKFIIVSVVYNTILFYFIMHEKHKTTGKIKIDTPFAIKPALIFGIIFFVLMAISNATLQYFGDSSLLIVSILGGMFNSAAVSASSALLFINGSISFSLFMNSIILASIGSMLNDIIYSFIFREPKLGKNIIKYVSIWIILLVIMMLF